MYKLYFSANPCPDLASINVVKGSWTCEQQKRRKSCENERTGQVCSLACSPPYRVRWMLPDRV